MNTEFDVIPDDFITQNFYDRCANPRGMMLRYTNRWWTPGVHADVDSGHAASTQADTRPVSEVISVRDHGVADTFLAEARWQAANRRWDTSQREEHREIGRTPGAAVILREGLGWAL